MSSLPFLGIGETVSAGRRLQVKLREGSRGGGREGGREGRREGREGDETGSLERGEAREGQGGMRKDSREVGR